MASGVMANAVHMPGRDEAVPAHYGSPLMEQRAFLHDGALIDMSHRSIVTVTGEDRLTWLHSLTTQHVSGLAVSVSTETLVLSAKGHIEHHLHVVDDGSATWLIGEPGAAETLVPWLSSMTFMLRVEVEDVSERFAVVAESGESAQLRGHRTWVSTWPIVPDTSMSYTPTPVAGHPGVGLQWREVIVARGELPVLRDAHAWAGMWAWDALRVAAWLPRMGAETDHRTIPHELDWLRSTTHLNKGCYRGQETIARVRNLGKPPRRLVHLHLDGSDHELPVAGADVVAGERTVGRLTTVARHYEDGPIALAVVKRSVPQDAQLVVGDGVSAAQQPIVVA